MVDLYTCLGLDVGLGKYLRNNLISLLDSIICLLDLYLCLLDFFHAY